jgi:dihydrofolate reductase
MAKLIVSENASLDGVIEDPTGEEGFSRGGWFTRLAGQDREAWAKVELEEALGSQALLLGRRTYEFFAQRWPFRTGAFADRLNAMPKYVVSSTLRDPAWNNSTVLRGDLATEVAKLKQDLTGDIVVYASGRLVPALLAGNLVDELRLILYPVVLGAGQRLFGPTGDAMPLRLVSTRTVGDNLANLAYELVRAG